MKGRVIGLLVLALAALAPSAASAASSHTYSHSIGALTSTPAAPYPVSAPSDVEIDQATGNVYVADPPGHRVQKFDKDGDFVLMFGKNVNQTTGGDVCTAASLDVCKSGTSSTAAGGFEKPQYLAVDNYPGRQGAVYVLDAEANIVSKFSSSGQLVAGWATGGQQDGAETGLSFSTTWGVAVGGPGGHLFVGSGSSTVWEFAVDGTLIPPYSNTCGNPWLKVDDSEPEHFYFTASDFFCQAGGSSLAMDTYITNPPPGPGEFGYPFEPGFPDYFTASEDRPTTGFNFDPNGELYHGVGERTGANAHPPRINHYVNCEPMEAVCVPADTFGEGDLHEAAGMAVDGETHAVYVANKGTNDVAVFADSRPIVTTGAPTNVTAHAVTLTGTIDPAGRGDVTECRFEYGFDTTYGHTVPCVPDPAASPPGSNFTSPTNVTATINGFSGGTRDHYRLVAVNSADGLGLGEDRIFQTTSRPAITGVAAEHLTATTADLQAVVNPNGLETSYRFEFGRTPDYGQARPVPDGSLSASFEAQKIEVHLEGLTPRAEYHYRLVAENDDGTTTVEDHTFNFYPPSCPNENVRQQTQANFLPDCRAYELVSPADAGGTQLYPFGPNTGYATSPPRFSYAGMFSTIPDPGGKPIDAFGDLYVSTRTNTGWVSRYVGWPADEASVVGGPFLGPPGSEPAMSRYISQLPGSVEFAGGAGRLQNSVFTDPGMDRFLSFNNGNQSAGASSGFDFENRTPIGSNAPRVYSAEGTLLGRWPTNLDSVPDGAYPPEAEHYFSHGGQPYPGEEPTNLAPGGEHALDCPTIAPTPFPFFQNRCPGDVTASADLSNFVFATRWHVFAPGGTLDAPGSVYDNDTDAGTVVVASKTPGGQNIQPEPTNEAGDTLQIPAVSKDGSHILMAAGTIGPCGAATCPELPCAGWVKRCPMQPSHLYMRVNGTLTYDVSRGDAVDYVGIDGAGTRVYFISDDQITSEDVDSSSDLYQWSQAGDSVTLVSKGDNEGNYGEPGNSDSCKGGLDTQHATETTDCGVATFSQWLVCLQPGGGNCLSDNSIAADSGDIYFFSQELLDGTQGIPDQANLYVYRNGAVHYVASLTGPDKCFEYGGLNNEKFPCPRIFRMQVSPDGKFAAFVSASEVTQYDSDGHTEMYRYRADDDELVCVSCMPSGEKPDFDVEASMNGLFMTNDGRAFFSTEDPLVHRDSNKALDVYEYVSGQPQLITLGTGETRQPAGGVTIFEAVRPGLVGVSADGMDVFFATNDTLVRQDHNGLFAKFYDARTGGGFFAPPPPPPCEAADECHGDTSPAPAALVDGTGANLGNGGNAAPAKHKKRKGKRAKRHRRGAHKQRAAKSNPSRRAGK
jgi:hypothetical protein